MSNLSTFDYESFKVRTLNEDGETVFVAKDVCDVLGYHNAAEATRVHVDSEDIAFRYTLTEGGRQKVMCINESGLYSLILGSKKPEAKSFKRWVTVEVLPSIRKNGSYSSFEAKKREEFKTAMSMAKSCKAIAKLFGATDSVANALVAQRVHREIGVDIKEFLIENIADVQDPLVTVTDIAKHLNIGRNSVNPMLVAKGLQTIHEGPSGDKRYELTAEGKKFGQYLDTGKKHSDGTPIQQIKWYKERVLRVVQ